MKPVWYFLVSCIHATFSLGLMGLALYGFIAAVFQWPLSNIVWLGVAFAFGRASLDSIHDANKEIQTANQLANDTW